MFHPEGPTFAELMKQALTSTERGYDLIAPKFDRTPFRTPDVVIDGMITTIGNVGSALDVCCGTGAVMTKLRAVCKERVVGLDFSQGMLDEAKRRVEASPGDAKVELVRGDALDLPFHEEMDVITCAGAFGHVLVEDEERFLAGIYRALKPGGRFVFPTTRAPKVTNGWFWMAHGFNAVMRVRNAVLRPQFIMYYLTFLWPEIRSKLERVGFDVSVEDFDRYVIVTAGRKLGEGSR